jgi:hypothetical protein
MKLSPSRAHQMMLAFVRLSNTAGGDPSGGPRVKAASRFPFNPQAGAGSRRFGSYQKVSRETFWYDLGQKPYKA